MAGTTKSVGVVILNWNGGELTGRCIESLERSDYPDRLIIVIDNGSTDGSAERLARDFPEVALLRNEKNLGFARGSNQGIRWAMEQGFDYALILNNDTLAAPNMISSMVAAAETRHDLAAVSPKIFFADTPERLWFTVGEANLWSGVFSNPAYNALDDGRYDSQREMGWMVGCCVLIPRKIAETVGGFDERFFAYCEDVDWSLRCRKAGFGLLYCPEARLWHKVSASGSRHSAVMRYLMTRNHLWAIRMHASALQFLCVLLWLPLRSSKRILQAIKVREWACITAELRGLRDGLLAPLDGKKTTKSSLLGVPLETPPGS